MRRRWLGWLFRRFLVAAVLYAGCYTGLNMLLTGAIRNEFEVLRGMDVAVDESDLPKPRRDGPDAGPLWRAATELWKDAERSLDEFPADTLDEYQLKMGAIRRGAHEPAPETALARLRALITEQQRILALLREAADRPGYTSVLKYDDGPAMELPSFVESRHMAHFTRLAAECAIVDGDVAGALEHWTALRGLCRWFTIELTLVSRLVGTVLENELHDSLVRALDTARFSDEELVRARTLIATPIKGEERLLESLNAELIYFGMTVMNAILDGEEMAFYPGGIPAMGLPRLVLKADKLAYLKVLRWQFVQIRRAFRERDFVFSPARAPWYASLTNLMVASVSNLSAKFVEAEARRLLTLYAIELRRYKLAKGAYPEVIREMAYVTSGADNMPFDPFTGKELIYRKKGDGFVLYSVGKDRTDNGGTTDEEQDIVVSLSR